MLKKESELCELLIEFKFLKFDKRNKFKEIIVKKNICPEELMNDLLDNPFILETEKNKYRKDILFSVANYLIDELSSFRLCYCCEADLIKVTYEQVLELIIECTETDKHNALNQKSLASKLGLKTDTLNNWLKKKVQS